ncbi:CFA47 protein, partial [Upupa epops]|nr:CFA47 protein [Upupa epops]
QFKLTVENPEKPVAPGLQVTAFVDYYPQREENLQDRLLLLIEDGTVDIPLLGFVPSCRLEMESEISFGAVIANSKIISKEISIANHGSRAGSFQISYEGADLLNIAPTRGVVEPKAVKMIQVDICTDVPRVVQEMLKVELEGQGCAEVRITAAVVQQVLRVLDVSCGRALDRLHFGPVYFGSSKTEQIQLYNESPESVDWIAVLEDSAVTGEMGTDLQRSAGAALQDLSLENVTGDVDLSTLILCLPSHGTLLPYEKSLVTLGFSPQRFPRGSGAPASSLKQEYVLFLRFETVEQSRGSCLRPLRDDVTVSSHRQEGDGPAHAALAVTGAGLPVSLTFDPGPVIKFTDCFSGEQTQVVCTLSNESHSLPVTFSFRQTAHFAFSPEKGKIERRSAKAVTLSFCPRQIGVFRVKQIVDIIGAALDRSSPQVLKTKSFHQIRLSLIGTCPSKPRRVVFRVNPGITPVVSNATGQFVADDAGPSAGTAPVALLKSARAPVHAHRLNRTCEDDALTAFPNDRAASIRPGERNRKYRTIFTKTERYNYIDPEFSYSDCERLSREAHKGHYADFISSLRQRRLQKAAARQFRVYNNPVDIGIKPAAGLLSPRISLTDLHQEKMQPKMLSSDENCPLTTRQLAASDSESSVRVRSGLGVTPSSSQEKEDCSLTLTSRQLHQIVIGPSTMDFGEVCVHSTTARKLHIINHLPVHIWIQMEIEMEELQQTGPLSQVVPPLTETHIPVVFETAQLGTFKRSFSYTINNRHLGHVLVVARAVPVELELSAKELILKPVPGYLAETEFRTTVRIHNRRNHPAEFTWEPVMTERGIMFSIQPAQGCVEAYRDLECEVVWHPGFNSPEEGEFNLCVHKGNTVSLKCSAKV